MHVCFRLNDSTLDLVWLKIKIKLIYEKTIEKRQAFVQGLAEKWVGSGQIKFVDSIRFS